MKKAMLLFISLLFTAGANAATFDFAAEALGDERGAEGEMFSNGGVTVTVSAVGPAVAYLDDESGGLPAGLGVCSSGLTGGNQCVDSSDDNVTGAERLSLAFDQAVRLEDVNFRNASHGTTFEGALSVLNVSTGISTVFALAEVLNLAILGKGTEFIFNIEGLGKILKANDEFYISGLNAEVPVPAALFLFAPALLGFFGLRRKASLAA
jgi:hypothetical protein